MLLQEKLYAAGKEKITKRPAIVPTSIVDCYEMTLENRRDRQTSQPHQSSTGRQRICANCYDTIREQSVKDENQISTAFGGATNVERKRAAE
jgi:hypothetical protein